MVTGYTPLFGAAAVEDPDTFVDQLPVWKAAGPIKQLQLFYSPSAGCLYGVKPTYGAKSPLFGSDAAEQAAELGLEEGEFFNEAQYKAGGK